MGAKIILWGLSLSLEMVLFKVAIISFHFWNKCKTRWRIRDEMNRRHNCLIFICRNLDELPDSTDIRSTEQMIRRKPSNRVLWTLTVSSWEQSWGVSGKRRQEGKIDLYICWDEVEPKLAKCHEISRLLRDVLSTVMLIGGKWHVNE